MAKNQKLVFLILGMLLVVQSFSFGEADEMEKGGAISPTAETSSYGENETAEAPEIRRLGKHHISDDKSSVAGGGVIIGGLLTAIFAAVFCYIRVTRKTSSQSDPHL